jgi:hypothetical protein
MDDRRKAVIIAVLAVVTGVSGVLTVEAVTGLRPGSTPAPSIARADVPGATAALPASSQSPSPPPTPAPTAVPKSSPTAAPPWKAMWSKPRLVDKESCGGFAVGIDAASRYHVVTSCSLRYSVTDGDGAWTTTTLGDSKELGPLIAFDRDQAYIAYWRVLPNDPDTCGGDVPPPSAGVYYRRRTLPDGGWSKAIPFGKSGDHLQAFRVEDGVLHAIAWNETSGRTFYIRSTQDPVVSARHRIDADGGVSLRVGEDGRARVAYWGGGSLRYGTFNGSGFSSSNISTGPTDGPAMLVLGTGNQPHVAYTIVPPTVGCGDGAQLSRAGTYYATMVKGKWTSQRITKKLGLSSLALDPKTGRVHVLAANTVYTKDPKGGWVSAGLPSGIESPVLRLDPTTGTLLVVYIRWSPDGDSDGLFAITSP